jgi:hypothetical protein
MASWLVLSVKQWHSAYFEIKVLTGFLSHRSDRRDESRDRVLFRLDIHAKAKFAQGGRSDGADGRELDAIEC